MADYSSKDGMAELGSGLEVSTWTPPDSGHGAAQTADLLGYVSDDSRVGPGGGTEEVCCVSDDMRADAAHSLESVRPEVVPAKDYQEGNAKDQEENGGTTPGARSSSSSSSSVAAVQQAPLETATLLAKLNAMEQMIAELKSSLGGQNAKTTATQDEKDDPRKTKTESTSSPKKKGGWGIVRDAVGVRNAPREPLVTNDMAEVARKATQARRHSAMVPEVNVQDDVEQHKVSLNLYSADVQGMVADAADEDGKLPDDMAITLLTLQARRDAQKIRYGSYLIIGLVVVVATLSISVTVLVQPLAYDEGSDVMRNPNTGNAAQCASADIVIGPDGQVMTRPATAAARRLDSLPAPEGEESERIAGGESRVLGKRARRKKRAERKAQKIAELQASGTRQMAQPRVVYGGEEPIFEQAYMHYLQNAGNATLSTAGRAWTQPSFQGEMGCETVRTLTIEASLGTQWMSLVCVACGGTAFGDIYADFVGESSASEHNLQFMTRKRGEELVTHHFTARCPFGPLSDTSTTCQDFARADGTIPPCEVTYHSSVQSFPIVSGRRLQSADLGEDQVRAEDLESSLSESRTSDSRRRLGKCTSESRRSSTRAGDAIR